MQDGVHDKFVKMLVDRAGKLVLGDGRKKGTDVGPLINEAALKKVERYVDIGKAQGATLALGGKRATGGDLDHGYFFQPTIFTGVKAKSRLEQEEIFGPVLSVIRVKDADEAFAVNNDVVYGLSSSVYTRDVNVAFRALHRARQRHHVHQRADHRRRGALAVRRREADRERPPRGRLGGVRVLLGDEGGVRRLLGHAAACADRQLWR